MEPKRSKYDTNPLDKDVRAHADQSWGTERREPGPSTDRVRGGATRDIGRTQNEAARANPETEAPTRRINDTSYPSVFIPRTAPQPHTYQPPNVSADIYQPPPVSPLNIYQAPPLPASQQASQRTVAGLNIPEKWANMLPYIPGHIGLIAAIVELILVPRTETSTRFHAAQGLALQVVILIISSGLGMIANITDNSVGSKLFWLASTAFLIVSMVRVFHGKTHRIAPLDEPANWLNEKIKPRK
jgi:uncharacterized membrane protein